MSAYKNLSGLWTGSYSYTLHGKQSVAFTAWIDDKAGKLSGTLLEANTFVDSPSLELTSTLEGTRSGTDLEFTKRYDPSQGAHASPIHYTGRTNQGFTFVTGQWSIAGPYEWSGPFEMSRQSGAFEKAQREEMIELIK